jgi:DNA-binding NarL/FixJ family response regulator
MQGQRPRAFLVDDNDGLRVAIRELLTDAGVEVVGEARDSGTALLAIPPAATSPLVVLMDVRLPGPVNGIEATRRLLERRAGVGVVIFTAFNGAAMERAALAAGAVMVLIKGAPAETVVAAVRRAWCAAALAS